ncbi:MAG: hypothetical protein RMM17_05235 [Acidobacteriota bacterium]|nr:hypothetical protein [Blastocatellia bacterium]MDW8412068.1 hypothetical protein [Acidobacteriota bacterium]
MRIGRVLDSVPQLESTRAVTVAKTVGSNLAGVTKVVGDLVPGLSAATKMAKRAGFPENPLSFENVKDIGKLLLGTIPLSGLAPDKINDGKIENYPKGGGLRSEPKVYLVNGIATNEYMRDQMGEQTAKALGSNVTFIKNATEGPITDLLQCVKELVFAVPSKPTETLANEIYKNLTAQPPQKMSLIGYSQGSIITTHALSLAITRMKQDGYSDEQIRNLMSENVRVTLVGCPVDLNNPAHTIANVPPGLPTSGTKRLDYYFTTQDRVLYGKNEPFDERITRETGPGELARPNFEIVRHDKDLVATTIHDLDLGDVFGLFKNPAEVLIRIGAQLIDDLGSSFKDTLNPVGYHMYEPVYLQHMVNRGLVF